MLPALLSHALNAVMRLVAVQDVEIRRLLGYVQIVDSKGPEVKPWDK